jgi:hypothetical protein
VIVLDGRRSRCLRSVFFDKVHLDRQGATTLSIDVAAIIGRYLADSSAGPHWVELPTYRDLATDVAVEDIDQSMLAVHQGVRRR